MFLGSNTVAMYHKYYDKACRARISDNYSINCVVTFLRDLYAICDKRVRKWDASKLMTYGAKSLTRSFLNLGRLVQVRNNVRVILRT